MINIKDIATELAGKVDNHDMFLKGHQIIKTAIHRRKRPPEWTQTDLGIQAVLLTSFPKLETDPVQRGRAARWARIIYLYYRMGKTRGQIAEELSMTPVNVLSMIRSITRVARGHASRNNIPRGKRGRPKLRHTQNKH